MARILTLAYFLMLVSCSMTSMDKHLSSSDMNTVFRKPGESLESMIERIPGVSVRRYPDGSFSIHIRGAESWVANTSPLVLVDGTEVRFTNNGRVRGINPVDVEKVQVLKDPVDTAIYGIRGANGVILITTTRPM